jgi:ABC-type bacteriocin/lantibiotic exporter with double-glycine peptidase domain
MERHLFGGWCAAIVMAGAITACAPHANSVRAEGASVPVAVHLTYVPFFPDNTDQCGPAALASILNFWGKKVFPGELRSEVYLTRLKGTLPMDMRPAIESRGLSAKVQDGTFEDLKKELQRQRPVIAYLDFGTGAHPIGHFVVVTGYDDQRGGLYIHSSLRRDKFASYQRFERGWKDTNHWMLAVGPIEPPPNLSQKRVIRVGKLILKGVSNGEG